MYCILCIASIIPSDDSKQISVFPLFFIDREKERKNGMQKTKRKLLRLSSIFMNLTRLLNMMLLYFLHAHACDLETHSTLYSILCCQF